jgi:hypothetical protein
MTRSKSSNKLHQRTIRIAVLSGSLLSFLPVFGLIRAGTADVASSPPASNLAVASEPVVSSPITATAQTPTNQVTRVTTHTRTRAS